MSPNLYGKDMFGASAAPKPSTIVASRFGFTPFTVLDSRRGEWQERKRAWLALGIRSETGRDSDLLRAGAGVKRVDSRPSGQVAAQEYEGGNIYSGIATSIFDPVLCELAYRWFCPFNGTVVDPFAGGSVRGLVAGAMGHRYWGCDLRAGQVEANNIQADRIEVDVRPTWVCGDSIDELTSAPDADFIFSCPPYGDLEIYSDDPRDLSNMEWHTFVAAYKRIILRAIAKLKDDRFACFVVGDFRDPKGFYRNFVGLTVQAFEECGARFYNEAIVAMPAGTAVLRVSNHFETGRKLAKTHQNVLVFCKGDPKKAAAMCRDDHEAGP